MAESLGGWRMSDYQKIERTVRRILSLLILAATAYGTVSVARQARTSDPPMGALFLAVLLIIPLILAGALWEERKK